MRCGIGVVGEQAGREVVALAREMLGGNGIVSDFLVAKQFCDMEVGRGRLLICIWMSLIWTCSIDSDRTHAFADLFRPLLNRSLVASACSHAAC